LTVAPGRTIVLGTYKCERLSAADHRGSGRGGETSSTILDRTERQKDSSSASLDGNDEASASTCARCRSRSVHEMRTMEIDVPVAWVSDSQSFSLSVTRFRCANMVEQIEVPFEVGDSWESKNIRLGFRCGLR